MRPCAAVRAHGPADRPAGGVARVQHPADAVRRLAGQRDLAVRLAIEGRPPVHQLVDVGRALGHQNAHRVDVAQPVAGRQRVLQVQPRVVVFAHRGGDAALGVAGIALGRGRLGQEQDLPGLGERERGPQRGDPAADDQVVRRRGRGSRRPCVEGGRPPPPRLRRASHSSYGILCEFLWAPSPSPSAPARAGPPTPFASAAASPPAWAAHWPAWRGGSPDRGVESAGVGRGRAARGARLAGGAGRPRPRRRARQAPAHRHPRPRRPARRTRRSPDGRRHRRRRRDRRSRRLRRGLLPARPARRAGADHGRRPGRQRHRRQGRRQPRPRQEPDRRLSSADRGARRSRSAGDAAGARAAGRPLRSGQIRRHRRPAPVHAARARSRSHPRRRPRGAAADRRGQRAHQGARGLGRRARDRAAPHPQSRAHRSATRSKRSRTIAASSTARRWAGGCWRRWPWPAPGAR